MLLTGFDGYNRLTKVQKGSDVTTYTYNGDGLRTSKTVNGVTTQFVLDGANVVLEITEDQITKYIRGINLIKSEKNGVETYYTVNGHGDVSQLVDSNGNIVKEYEYDAFGNQLTSSENDDNPFRYCGEYYDEETGFIYLRARYYDTATGRFISEDPHWNPSNMIYGDNPNKDNPVPNMAAIVQSSNLYVYCSSNPVNLVDPTGNYSSGSMADFHYANRRWGVGTTMWLNGIANECLSAAQKYATNNGFSGTWNNQADAYRHFLWNARLTREFGYYEARDITNQHEYNSLATSGWLSTSASPNSSVIATKMNQESFMDLWNNQVGRELANNAAFKHMSYDQLFNMAIDNNWLITDASKAFNFLGIESYITDYNSYTVDVLWDTNSGNITVYANGKSVELKIGV